VLFLTNGMGAPWPDDVIPAFLFGQWTVTKKSIALQDSPCATRIVKVTGFSCCEKTPVLYQGTTLEAAEKLTKVPKGRLTLAQDVILGSRIEDE
jgi:hypothetical protein